MEAQSFLSGVCPKLSVPSIRHGKESLFSKLPALPSLSFCSFVQSQKLASRGTFKSITYKESSRKRIKCSSNAEPVRVVTAEVGNIRAQVRRKKLAVFVSGGGSNFRSIHEATIQGLVHGDISVLVTNKSAFGGKGYYGIRVHKAVIASGARYSGPTIHIVDEHYDTGRIIAQRVVPVLANDTAEELAARVLRQEHRLYVEVVEALCEERIVWREDGVPLIQSKENPDELS